MGSPFYRSLQEPLRNPDTKPLLMTLMKISKCFLSTWVILQEWSPSIDQVFLLHVLSLMQAELLNFIQEFTIMGDQLLRTVPSNHLSNWATNKREMLIITVGKGTPRRKTVLLLMEKKTMVMVEKMIPERETVTTDWQQESDDHGVGHKGEPISPW